MEFLRRSAPDSSSAQSDIVYPTDGNDYEILGAVNQGKTGVFRAFCKPLSMNVAIKTMDLESISDLDNLRKEIHIMNQSSHSNIVTYHASFVRGSNLHLVMDLLEGSVLDIMRICAPDGFHDEEIVAAILKQVLLGLAYFHANSQIHRDIKAKNLLVDKNGVVQLTDFGLTAWMVESGSRQRSRKTFAGDPYWMAPEVLEQVQGYDCKADIWSFGITALELIHGKPPYHDMPPMKVLLATLEGPPPAVAPIPEGFSKYFKDMVESCLQKDPLKRPTAAKLLEHKFFKSSRKPEVVLQNLLVTLPPLRIRAPILPSHPASSAIPSDSSASVPSSSATAESDDSSSPPPLSVAATASAVSSDQQHQQQQSKVRLSEHVQFAPVSAHSSRASSVSSHSLPLSESASPILSPRSPSMSSSNSSLAGKDPIEVRLRLAEKKLHESDGWDFDLDDESGDEKEVQEQRSPTSPTRIEPQKQQQQQLQMQESQAALAPNQGQHQQEQEHNSLSSAFVTQRNKRASAANLDQDDDDDEHYGDDDDDGGIDWNFGSADAIDGEAASSIFSSNPLLSSTPIVPLPLQPSPILHAASEPFVAPASISSPSLASSPALASSNNGGNMGSPVRSLVPPGVAIGPSLASFQSQQNLQLHQSQLKLQQQQQQLMHHQDSEDAADKPLQDEHHPQVEDEIGDDELADVDRSSHNPFADRSSAQNSQFDGSEESDDPSLSSQSSTRLGRRVLSSNSSSSSSPNNASSASHSPSNSTSPTSNQPSSVKSSSAAAAAAAAAARNVFRVGRFMVETVDSNSNPNSNPGSGASTPTPLSAGSNSNTFLSATPSSGNPFASEPVAIAAPRIDAPAAPSSSSSTGSVLEGGKMISKVGRFTVETVLEPSSASSTPSSQASSPIVNSAFTSRSSFSSTSQSQPFGQAEQSMSSASSSSKRRSGRFEIRDMDVGEISVKTTPSSSNGIPPISSASSRRHSASGTHHAPGMGPGKMTSKASLNNNSGSHYFHHHTSADVKQIGMQLTELAKSQRHAMQMLNTFLQMQNTNGANNPTQPAAVAIGEAASAMSSEISPPFVSQEQQQARSIFSMSPSVSAQSSASPALSSSQFPVFAAMHEMERQIQSLVDENMRLRTENAYLRNLIPPFTPVSSSSSAASSSSQLSSQSLSSQSSPLEPTAVSSHPPQSATPLLTPQFFPMAPEPSAGQD